MFSYTLKTRKKRGRRAKPHVPKYFKLRKDVADKLELIARTKQLTETEIIERLITKFGWYV
ncbi:MAG: hypothetical protein DRN03_05275 [Thermoplasmata archaeon]|nr:MAG: hypothetical protein DRN03_05275 [Thermoplasmata archaeon]